MRSQTRRRSRRLPEHLPGQHQDVQDGTKPEVRHVQDSQMHVRRVFRKAFGARRRSNEHVPRGRGDFIYNICARYFRPRFLTHRKTT